MNADWKKLQHDIEALKISLTSLRAKCDELAASDIENLLVPLRSCMVEMIALRSTLERQKHPKTHT